MPSNIILNIDYDKTELLDLFNNSERLVLNNFNRVVAILGDNFSKLPIFTRYLDMFNFIPKSDLSIELLQITGNSKPHINPGNNGLLIFPVSGTPLILNTYSYTTPHKDENGRLEMDSRSMSSDEISAIESTLIESVPIEHPIAVDGLTTLSFHVTTEPYPIVLVLKINKMVDWADVYSFIKRYEGSYVNRND